MPRLNPLTGPRFRPRLETLDDRITPALAFAGQLTFDTGGANPTGVAVADFNSDGRADIAAINGGANTLSVLVNTAAAGGTPTFATTAGYLTGAGPGAVAVGDFNGDGRPDIAVGNTASNTVSVFLNTTAFGAATPTFLGQAVFVAGANPAALAVADFNGDGRDDIAVSSSPLVVLLNTTPVYSGVLSFSNPLPVSTVANRGALAVGDFNADGRPDIATSDSIAVSATPTYVNSVRIWSNTTQGGNLSFAQSAAYNSPVVPTVSVFVLATGEFNGDGRPDIAVTDGNSSVTILANATPFGNAAPVFGGLSSGSFGSAVTGPALVGDFDGDGRSDLAAAVAGSQVSVLLNNTPTTTSVVSFDSARTFGVGTTPVAVAGADFNGDGRVEIAAADSSTSLMSVLPNTSTGATVTGPVLVAQFGTAGVWRYNRAGTWDQLTASNANALATSPGGRVVASFGSAGVWYFNPVSGWSQINGYQANAVAIDALGNVYASFPGFGVAIYRLVGGWGPSLTSVPATSLAVNNRGELAAAFPGYGVYRYSVATGFTLLNTYAPTTLDIAENGDVVASFAGFGVNVYRSTTGWQRINGYDATSVAFGGGGQVAANFAGFGVAKYTPSANYWQSVNALPAVTVAMDLFGNVFESFTGSGVFEFNPYFGSRVRTASVASLIALGS
jgi:hypothetical protein